MKLTVRRGRPTAAHSNEAAKAERAAVIRAMRDRGMTYRDIADELVISVDTAHVALNGRRPKRQPLAANDNKRIYEIPTNSGCSTTSGLARISVPRVPTLEKPEIAPELAVAFASNTDERMAA